MRPRTFRRLRRRLSYANVMATLAFFFALTGASMAGVKYIAANDVIPATSDLAGSTYGNPLIAAGKVTSGKIADGAITSAKFDGSATAPNAANVGGLNVVIVSDTFSVPAFTDIGHQLTCPGSRLAVHATMTNAGPDVSLLVLFWDRDGGTYGGVSSVNEDIVNNGSTAEPATMNLYCLGA
jgi:hypothetical protein